ncbi:unnamed protein product [Blepharisma stoltei]|uniref:Uncharacterized protein n=1 Tax=Blepharisma stoltei TaxID=1481888 RepID=A0AAU9K8I0_9CILI|nr:unnamed protein product [Blepharisma stoltei]
MSKKFSHPHILIRLPKVPQDILQEKSRQGYHNKYKYTKKLSRSSTLILDFSTICLQPSEKTNSISSIAEFLQFHDLE